jgi:DNA (cytosine-5)-methyltransferase 1
VNVFSLFSGIGGLELGLERAGMTTVAQVEIDPYCRRVLEKHWPEVPRHDDVRTCVDWWRGEPRPVVDLVCGGFPCQPIAQDGHRLGTADPRWLWPFMAAVVRQIRPRYVLVENVADLVVRGLGDVLGDLAALGYDAEWQSIPAASVGAPHRRERIFIVAYPHSIERQAARVFTGDSRPHLGLAEAWRSVPRRGTGGRVRPFPVDWHERVADGVPATVDELRALGNAVVPQVAEHVGRLILAADREQAA